jgi:hypothetical protein
MYDDLSALYFNINNNLFLDNTYFIEKDYYDEKDFPNINIKYVTLLLLFNEIIQ